MQPASSSLDAQWPDLVAAVSAAIDLEATARASGALVRRRAIRSAEMLLRLALAYGPGRGQWLGGPVRHGGHEAPAPGRPLAGRGGRSAAAPRRGRAADPGPAAGATPGPPPGRRLRI